MSGIFDAYLAGAARPFFGGQHYTDAGDRGRAVGRAARPLSPVVAEALEAQNARFEPCAARAAHLDALRRGAAAVVTGQQVGLFLGPLYTIYKAAAAIRVARSLAAESGRPVVPVFWLQTEDHDLPEIAECHVPGAEGPVALRVPSAADRISIAHRLLPDEVVACLECLRAEIGHLPHAAPHLARLARHYRPGAGWAEAFGGVLAELFAEEGMVLIDARDAALARVAVPVHRRALLEAEAIAAALLERGRALASAGFGATVHVRAGAPLSFFHPDGAAGPRYRLEPAPHGFAEVGGEGVHTRDELLEALDAEPLRFSTSALLRPILQDTMLPTAAYVAGPGEVAYFAQLAPLYAAYALPMPLVVPRASFRIVDERSARLLAHLNLAPGDTVRPEDELLAACRGGGRGEPDAPDLRRTLLAPFAVALDAMRTQLESAGPGLSTAVEKTRATVEMAVKKLSLKLEKARLHRDEALVLDVRRLKQLLYPNGGPQERCYGVSGFAARYGERELIERVIAAVEPFDPRLRDLHGSASAGTQERAHEAGR